MKIGKLIGRRGAVATFLALVLSLAVAPAMTSAAVPSFHVGSRPTFRSHTTAAAAKSSGVYLTIAAKRKVNKNGELLRTTVGTFAQMHSKGHGNYAWTAPAYTFPDWFMMRPGKYFWQTYYVDCNANTACHALSSIKAFRVIP